MDEIYDRVMYDLNKLGEWSKELVNRQGVVDTKLYLQITSIQIFIISQLEYFLTKKGIIKNQSEIIKIIKGSSLEQLEKDHLIYLFLIRHTLIHNGGHYDSKFLENIKLHIKELKLKGHNVDLLSSVSTKSLSMYIELTKKLIDDLHV